MPVRVGHTVGGSKRWRVVLVVDQCVRLTDRGWRTDYIVRNIPWGRKCGASIVSCRWCILSLDSHIWHLRVCVCVVCVRSVHIRYLCVCYSPSFKKYTSPSRVVRISINIKYHHYYYCVSSRAMTP